MSRGSIGGVTVGNAWMRNNPDLVYPEGHENMTDEELEKAIRAEYRHPQNVEKRPDNIYRGCCEWWTFRDTFLASCRRMKVPLLCVNRLQARRHWRSGWTGFESADWFRIQLIKETY